MLSPRQRRLVADYEAVRAEFAGHEHVRVEPIGHLPPEAYRVTYKVKGLRLDGDQPVVAEEHVVDLRLPLGYPREQPLASPLTPVFHPNIAATYCIGDYWSAGQPLADIIAKIGDMIQYRVFNVKSPLDAVAARWAAENDSIFPIGNVELGAPELDIEIKPKAAAEHDDVDEDEEPDENAVAEAGDSDAGEEPEPEPDDADEPDDAPAEDAVLEISLKREPAS